MGLGVSAGLGGMVSLGFSVGFSVSLGGSVGLGGMVSAGFSVGFSVSLGRSVGLGGMVSKGFSVGFSVSLEGSVTTGCVAAGCGVEEGVSFGTEPAKGIGFGARKVSASSK